jgi:hypothetical protein
VPFDAATLEFAIRKTLERMAERLAAEPHDLSALEELDAAVGMARSLPFEVVFWRAQNIYYNMMQTVYREFRDQGRGTDGDARAWMACFQALGEKLSVRVE